MNLYGAANLFQSTTCSRYAGNVIKWTSKNSQFFSEDFRGEFMFRAHGISLLHRGWSLLLGMQEHNVEVHKTVSPRSREKCIFRGAHKSNGGRASQIFNSKHTFTCLLIMFLASFSGCTRWPVVVPDDGVSIISGHPIIAYQGQAATSLFSVHSDAGAQQMTVRFKSARYSYDCEFYWTALSGSRYEVRHDDHPMPLMLYEWVRVNALWAELINPKAPEQCKIVSGRDVE